MLYDPMIFTYFEQTFFDFFPVLYQEDLHNHKFNVAIVGAGPSGLAMAIFLSRLKADFPTNRTISITLFEKRSAYIRNQRAILYPADVDYCERAFPTFQSRVLSEGFTLRWPSISCIERTLFSILEEAKDGRISIERRKFTSDDVTDFDLIIDASGAHSKLRKQYASSVAKPPKHLRYEPKGIWDQNEKLWRYTSSKVHDVWFFPTDDHGRDYPECRGDGFQCFGIRVSEDIFSKIRRGVSMKRYQNFFAFGEEIGISQSTINTLLLQERKQDVKELDVRWGASGMNITHGLTVGVSLDESGIAQSGSFEVEGITVVLLGDALFHSPPSRGFAIMRAFKFAESLAKEFLPQVLYSDRGFDAIRYDQLLHRARGKFWKKQNYKIPARRFRV